MKVATFKFATFSLVALTFGSSHPLSVMGSLQAKTATFLVDALTHRPERGGVLLNIMAISHD
jgi:hypothetical protein